MENENQEQPIKKSKKGLMLCILAIIIIAILVGGVYYYKSQTKAANVFAKQINEVIDSYGEEEEYDTINATVALSGKIDTEEESVKPIAEYINKSKITFNVQMDNKAKTENVNLDVDYDNEKLIKAQAYYADGDNNLYLYVNDLFDKYFKVALDSETGEMFNQESLSLGQKLATNKVRKILKQEIKEALKEEYFSQEKVDGEKKSTMKVTVLQLKSIIVEVCNNLQNNEEFLNCYENQNDVKESLAEVVSTIQEEVEYDNYNVEIAIYTKGMFANEVTKVELTIIDENNNKATLNVSKVDDENYEFYVNIQTEENNMEADVNTLKGTLKIEKVNDTTEKYIISMAVPDLGNVTINLEVSAETNKELEKVDVSNNVDVENLSEEDMTKIYTNLQKMKLFELLAPLFMGSSMLQ